MAIIKISEISNWSTNRWIYNKLLEDILAKLSDKDILYKKLECSLQDGSFFFDLSSCSYKHKLIFSHNVKNIFNQLKKEGHSSFESPEFYEGFIEKLNELKELLDT